MKRRRILLLLALAVVAAGIALCGPRGPKEPEFEGKRLGLWLDETLTDSTPEAHDQAERAAERAIKAIGTNAIPWLIYEFTRTEPKWREALRRWTGMLMRRGFQLTADEIRHARASAGLELLGPNLAPALPELAKVLHGQDLHRVAGVGYLMAQAGKQAIPYLIQGLASTNVIDGYLVAAYASANGLGWLAAETEEAVPPLIRALQSTNMPVRVEAAFRLGHVPFRPELTIPALTAALHDPKTNVSNTAAQSLSIMREESAPLVAELRRLIAGTNGAVALTASNALNQLEKTNWSPRRP